MNTIHKGMTDHEFVNFYVLLTIRVHKKSIFQITMGHVKENLLSDAEITALPDIVSLHNKINKLEVVAKCPEHQMGDVSVGLLHRCCNCGVKIDQQTLMVYPPDHE